MVLCHMFEVLRWGQMISCLKKLNRLFPSVLHDTRIITCATEKCKARQGEFFVSKSRFFWNLVQLGETRYSVA
jgi:hypothetical protein